MLDTSLSDCLMEKEFMVFVGITDNPHETSLILPGPSGGLKVCYLLSDCDCEFYESGHG